MRYTHIFHPPPSPSDAGLIKAKTGPLALHKVRLPTSRHHCIRKASISTTSTASRSNSVERVPGEATRPVQRAPSQEVIAEDENDKIVKVSTPKKPARLQLKAWESYLHWLCLTEEPGTLWSSSLCTAFRDCLAGHSNGKPQLKAGECAHRIDDIYWSFYLPLDPLFSFKEDRILSGYLLHVWTMFIELGKRIPYDDPAQGKLVELLKELVHLPPMEVRTWEGNDAPWTDLPTLDDALIAAWDDLYDPEIRTSDPESQWVNYFAFLGRLVAAEVTPDWFEIPATTLKEVLLEDVEPSALTEYKTRALAEYLNQAGEGFMDWCIDSGMLDANKSMDIVAPLLKSPVRQDWFGGRGAEDKAVQESQTRGRKRSEA